MKTDVRTTDWWWIKAPRTIEALGIMQGDYLLVNIATGQILGADRRF